MGISSFQSSGLVWCVHGCGQLLLLYFWGSGIASFEQEDSETFLLLLVLHLRRLLGAT